MGLNFFTVTLAGRRSRVLTDHVATLRGVFRRVRAARPFEIVAVVVLPEHLHTVWTLPEGDADYSGRWKAIKGISSSIEVRFDEIQWSLGKIQFRMMRGV